MGIRSETEVVIECNADNCASYENRFNYSVSKFTLEMQLKGWWFGEVDEIYTALCPAHAPIPDPGKTAPLTEAMRAEIRTALTDLDDIAKTDNWVLANWLSTLLAENERLEKEHAGQVKLKRVHDETYDSLALEYRQLQAKYDALEEQYSSLSEFGRPSDGERIAELEQLLSIEALCIAEISISLLKRDNKREAMDAKRGS